VIGEKKELRRKFARRGSLEVAACVFAQPTSDERKEIKNEDKSKKALGRGDSRTSKRTDPKPITPGLKKWICPKNKKVEEGHR